MMIGSHYIKYISMLRNKYFSLTLVVITSFLICSCSQIKTDVFAIQNATLLSPLESFSNEQTISFGPLGAKTIPIRVHRLVESQNGWILGVRRHYRNAWLGTQQRYVTKLTLSFSEKPLSGKEYDLAKDRDKVRVIYSSINPQYVEGYAAEASFGSVHFKWLTKTQFTVDVNAAFDMKHGMFCRAELINEVFQGEVISFDQLTPWLGVANELDSFEGMHQELLRE